MLLVAVQNRPNSFLLLAFLTSVACRVNHDTLQTDVENSMLPDSQVRLMIELDTK